MANADIFKLFKTVDPTKINVPLKEKFAKLTLSARKKLIECQQMQQVSAASPKSTNISRHLFPHDLDLHETEKAAVAPQQTNKYENPLLCSDSSASLHELSAQIDEMDHSMEKLQFSPSQKLNQPDEIDNLSVQVSNLKVTAAVPANNDASIVISSSSESASDSSSSCILIDDSTTSEDEPLANSNTVPQSPEVSAQSQQQLPQPEPLSSDKLQRIEDFLRDVSLENRVGGLESPQSIHTKLANADTESMSIIYDGLSSMIVQDLPSTPLATPLASPAQVDSSKRLADNDTEINTLCSDDMQANSTLNNSSEAEQPVPHLDESVTIPETSSELETFDSPQNSAASTPQKSSATSTSSADVQVTSINISAKVNIKIHVAAHSETDTESEVSNDFGPIKRVSSGEEQQDSQATPRQQKRAKSIILSEPTVDDNFRAKSEKKLDDIYNDTWKTPDVRRCIKRQVKPRSNPAMLSEEEQTQDSPDEANKDTTLDFLKSAKMLTALYGDNAWQTPEVLRTLKRFSNNDKPKSGAKQPLQDGNSPRTKYKKPPKTNRRKDYESDNSLEKLQLKAGISKNREVLPKNTGPQRYTEKATPNESMVGEFCQFQQGVEIAKLNSTRLPNKPAAIKSRMPLILDLDSSSGEITPNKIITRKVIPARKIGPTPLRDKQKQTPTDRIEKKRWNRIVLPDSNSESDNDYVDDEDADETSSSEEEIESGPNGEITFVDLTLAELEIPPRTKPQTNNHDTPKQNSQLDDILRNCRATEKRKMPATPTATPAPNTCRELFKDKRLDNIMRQLDLINGSPVCKTPVGEHVPKKPVFTPRFKTPKPTPKSSRPKYSFLKSLEQSSERGFCDPEAVDYRDCFVKKREQLTKLLYDMYNEKVFDNKLDVPITWNNKLKSTAGKCRNKMRLQVRSSSIELSLKVLTSASRLRCTLIHEMCHAAAWIFNGENSHGRVWRNWADRAERKLQDLPRITVCHNYQIFYKYSYECTGCKMSSQAHSKKKVDNIRCALCKCSIAVFLNTKGKNGEVVKKPVREAQGFAKFIKDNYHKHKDKKLPAPQVMRILKEEFAELKRLQALETKENDSPTEV